MRKFLLSPLEPEGLRTLFKYNIGLCLLLFAAVEIWRPYFFLTDDNFSELWPLFNEMGRQLKSGQSPFISHYIFGGNYNLARDLTTPFWHPFYLLPTLLADTPGRFAIVEVIVLLQFLLTAAGFTLLARTIVREFNPELPVIYILFYTASFLFSTYILTVGSSWMQFLGNQSALPWLTLGILDRRVLKGTVLVLIFSLHEIFSAYSASTVFNGIYLSLFAAGMSFVRRSPTPLASWIFGNAFTILVASPFLLYVVDGFAHSGRIGGMSIVQSSEWAIPAAIYPFSFFLGNWTTWVAALFGPNALQSDKLPYASVMLACAAAWCLIPALMNTRPWRGLEMLCAVFLVSLVILTIRPESIALLMHRIPFLKSTRWPFRECLQLLFFFHLLLLARTPPGRSSAIFVAISLAMFILPLPFGRIPTLNPLKLDREQVLSGKADAFWNVVKTKLDAGAQMATVLDRALWKQHQPEIPYSLSGTANFPAYFRVRCITGYSPTAPNDQLVLKTQAEFWFGAFRPDQVPLILAVKPDLELIKVEGVEPLRLSLIKNGQTIDLTPYIHP